MAGFTVQLKVGTRLPVSKTRWPKIECWLDNFVIFHWSRSVFQRKNTAVCFLGGPDLPVHNLDPRMAVH